MASGGGMFSLEEVAYLKELPAVAEATPRRIIYAEDFKVRCMQRYKNGESPVKLFREAGLDPALIGYKRIERCFSRWKSSDFYRDDRQRTYTSTSLSGGLSEIADKSSSLSGDMHPRAISFPTSSRSGAIDMRDLLIYQQVRRIDELEQQVDRLQAKARAWESETTQQDGGDCESPDRVGDSFEMNT